MPPAPHRASPARSRRPCSPCSLCSPRRGWGVASRAGLALGAAVLVGGAAWAQSLPLAWQGRVGLASEYSARGLLLGQGALGFASLDAYAPAGWSLGGGLLVLRDTADQLAQGGVWRLGYAPHAGNTCRPFLQLRQDRFFHSDVLAAWGGSHGSLGWQCDDRWSLTLNHDRLRAKALSATSLDFSLQ